MKVLLVYPWAHHNRMMNKLSEVLNDNGIAADVFCLANCEFITKNRSVLVLIFILLYKMIKGFRPMRFRGRLRNKYERYIFPMLFGKYDKIEFHAFIDHYLNMISGCVANNIKYDLCLWGSDVLRASELDFRRREFGYVNCNRIKSIELLQRKLSSAYEGRFDSKFSTVYFGNSNYSVIDEVTDEDCLRVAQELGLSVHGKINVVCGYNGMATQQHKLMLTEIERLSSEEKDKIHVVIPMTYEKKEDYREEIEQILKSMKVSYVILDNYLSPKQLAVLRHMSSITLNTQTTDAFCGALQESLYCGNVVMIADWLEYPPYDKNGVYYIKSKVEDFHTHLSQILSDYSLYCKKTDGNHEKLSAISSWDGVSLTWVNSYKS